MSDLNQLIEVIKGHHAEVVKAQGKALDAAIRAGEPMEKAKAIIKKEGKTTWEKFVNDTFGITRRGADNYINVFKHSGELRKALKDGRLPAWTMTAALAFLSKSKGPKQRRQPGKVKRVVSYHQVDVLLDRFGIGLEVDEFIELLDQLGIVLETTAEVDEEPETAAQAAAI